MAHTVTEAATPLEVRTAEAHTVEDSAEAPTPAELAEAVDSVEVRIAVDTLAVDTLVVDTLAAHTAVVADTSEATDKLKFENPDFCIRHPLNFAH